MEHREGATLADEMARAPLPVPELLRRAIELATVLNLLHRRGRVHGGLEPGAIVLTAAGMELTEPAAGPRPVTPYTAPEQLREKTDARSDIFSFGAIVYELAAGYKALAGDTAAEIEDAVLEHQPRSLTELPHEAGAAAFYTALDRIVGDCLVKNPEQRRQRVHNVLVDLKLMSSAARAATPKPSRPTVEEICPPRETEVKPLEPRSAEPVVLPPPAAPQNLVKAQPPALPAVPEPAPEQTPAPYFAPEIGASPPAPLAEPIELPPAPAAAPAIAAPEPAPFAQASVADPTHLPPPAESESEDDRAIAERRASAILSDIGFGQTAPYVMDPAELREHGRAKKTGKVEDKSEPTTVEEVPELVAEVGQAEAPKSGSLWDLITGRERVTIQLESEGQKRHWIWVFRVAAALAVAALLAFAGWAASVYLRKPSARQGVLRFALPAPEQGSYLSSPAISPDGKLLAFSAVGPDKKRLLWLSPLSSLKAEPIANTDDALAPFWSPDSKILGFFAGKKLKKVAADGGPVTVLCDTDGLAGGGTWSKDGVIVFGRSFYDGLYRVSAAGGDAERVTKLDSGRGERAHLWPLFLPDGKHFLFYALCDQDDNNGVSVGSLDTKTAQHLISADTNALYAEKVTDSSKQGYLLYAHSRRLTAQAFDPVKLALGSEQFTVADDINYLEFINLLPISAANNGVLAYQPIDAPKRQLVWIDREGNQVGVLGEPAEYGQARLSPDGRHVAVNRQAPGQETADIWLFDVDTNRSYPFTAEPTHEGAPVWSPDGSQLVYFSNPNGRFDLFRKGMGTSSRQEALAVSGADKYPNDWSPDGKYLLYGSIGASTGSDLWVLPMKTKGDPFVYLQTVATEGYARFSPDGKWVAYQSDESGRAEVYVEPFPRIEGRSKRWVISTEGGGLPTWRGDGKELYYIMGNGKIMAVSLNTREGLTPSAPRLLFQTRALPRTWKMYDVTSDGRRFLVNTPLEWASSSPITVVANWTEGFKK